MRIKITRMFGGHNIDENMNVFSIVIASVFNEEISIESISCDKCAKARCTFEFGDFRTDLKMCVAISEKINCISTDAFTYDRVLSTIESLRKYADEVV